MKKLFIGAVSAMLIAGSTAASAHDYKNEAFWGKWKAAGNTEDNYTELYINYIDNDSIQVDLKQVIDGKELFDFTEYTGTVTNNKDDITAALKFDYTDEYGTTKSGYMELAMFLDNIWLTVRSDDNIVFFDNAVWPENSPFNPYRSPFSSKCSIFLNGNKQSFTDADPFIVSGITYIPLRGLLDSMNLNVYWDEANILGVRTQMITTARNNMILQFKRSDSGKGFGPWTLSRWDSAYADTLAEPNDTIDISTRQPVIMNDRSYVPLRVLSEGYGAKVDWDDSTKSVLIEDNIASDTKKSASEVASIEKFTIEKADQIAEGYVGMVRYDVTPRYSYKSKYYIYVQAEKLYKVFNDGSVVEIQ